MKGSNNKLFGKWNELALLLIGFFMTTIVGGLFAYWIQNRAWAHQYHQTLVQSEKQNAEKIYTDVTCFMENRVYRMRRIVWATDMNLTNKELIQRWNDYDFALQEWNHNFKKYAELLRIYFGENSYRTFVFKIRKHLSDTNNMLQLQIKQKKMIDYQKAMQQINFNHEEINMFELDLFRKLQRRNGTI